MRERVLAPGPEQEKGRAVREAFSRIARWTSQAAGSATAFVLASAVVVVWLVSGPIFRFSSNWQLIINTGTTIVTFLMVFLIQAAQNRDAKAVQLKLDELIKAVKGARTELVDLESLSDEELDTLEKQFERIHGRAARRAEQKRAKP